MKRKRRKPTNGKPKNGKPTNGNKKRAIVKETVLDKGIPRLCSELQTASEEVAALCLQESMPEGAELHNDFATAIRNASQSYQARFAEIEGTEA